MLKADSELVHDLTASPNFGERRQNINMIILHYTGMATGQAALERLCDPAAQASCHYMIWEDGRISQLVAEAQRAWHAGVSRWGEISDINSASIGIELVHVGWESGPPLFPDDQISACIAL